MKLKFEIKKEREELINTVASSLGLYDHNFKDNPEVQCSGYHAFRNLILRVEEIPPGIEDSPNIIDNDILCKNLITNRDDDIFLTLTRLHPGIRKDSIRVIRQVRNSIRNLKREV